MGKPSPQRQIQNIMGNIWQHVTKNEYPCMAKDCTRNAINSHLLMVNGILNNVAENGHLVECGTKSIFALKQGEHSCCFKKVGVSQAASLPLFCNLHDTEIFSEIEQQDADYTNYRHLLLYTYRTVCAELRQKEIAHEVCRRILSSRTLQDLMPEEQMMTFEYHRQGLSQGISDFHHYIEAIMEDLTGNTKHFTFSSFTLPIKGIYAATVSTLFSDIYDTTVEVMPQFIFQAVPLPDATQIIMGYHNDYVNPQMIEYIQLWNNVANHQLGRLLTGLLIHVERWGMSPSLYSHLKTERVQEFYDYFLQSISWAKQNPTNDINLFEGIF